MCRATLFPEPDNPLTMTPRTKLKRAPQRVVAQIASIPGVQTVETRIVQGALATHSWGNYHWARTANPFASVRTRWPNGASAAVNPVAKITSWLMTPSSVGKPTV